LFELPGDPAISGFNYFAAPSDSIADRRCCKIEDVTSLVIPLVAGNQLLPPLQVISIVPEFPTA
jgi:hypothetical protein